MTNFAPVFEDRQNGAHHQNGGRAVPILPVFTFPYSGYTVQCRKLTQGAIKLISRRIEKERPAPKPPQVQVKIGDQVTVEDNPNDPIYQEAARQYDQWARYRSGELTWEYIVNQCLVVEIDHALVAQIRAEFSDVLTDNDTDRDIFLEHFVMPRKGDIDALFTFVTSESQPTEEAVQAHVESFRG